jgi:uncharacterized MAPEG superfamily protein
MIHMTIALFCILIAAVLPIVCAGIAKQGMFNVPRSEGGYDNKDPRGWLQQQEGRRKWANNAQANSFEALPFFASAVIIAHILGSSGALLNALAALFVVLRIVYIGLYLTGKQAMRSLVWIGAFAVNVMIFLLPVFK